MCVWAYIVCAILKNLPGINCAEKSIFICADIFVSFAVILFTFALKQLITLIVLIYFVYMYI